MATEEGVYGSPTPILRIWIPRLHAPRLGRAWLARGLATLALTGEKRGSTGLVYPLRWVCSLTICPCRHSDTSIPSHLTSDSSRHLFPPPPPASIYAISSISSISHASDSLYNSIRLYASSLSNRINLSFHQKPLLSSISYPLNIQQPGVWGRKPHRPNKYEFWNGKEYVFNIEKASPGQAGSTRFPAGGRCIRSHLQGTRGCSGYSSAYPAGPEQKHRRR